MADGSGLVVFQFTDGEEYSFRLRLKELRELQDKTGIGPYALYRRILSREWLIEDLRQTIRLGFIGGGMDPAAAATLIRNNVDGRPLMDSVEPALRILNAALVGADGDTPKKAAAEGMTETAQTESPSPTLSDAPLP